MNAFNFANWQQTIRSLCKTHVNQYLVNCVRSYFSQRRVKTGSISQGSILGPTLWNVQYDGVLRLPYNNQVKAIGYADDLLFVVRGDDEAEVIDRVRMTVGMAV